MNKAYARALEKMYEYNLMPAILPGKKKTHPDLYDRMLEAGVEPSYPRPPAPRMRASRLLFSAIVVVTVVSFCIFEYVFYPNLGL